jgi:hypothetical protein
MNSSLAAWLILLAALGGASSLLPALEEQLQGNGFGILCPFYFQVL